MFCVTSRKVGTLECFECLVGHFFVSSFKAWRNAVSTVFLVRVRKLSIQSRVIDLATSNAGRPTEGSGDNGGKFDV